MYQHITVPADGQKITVNADFSLNVPDNPIVPFIEGDGTGIDISPVMIKVIDAAVAKAYGARARSAGWKSMREKNRRMCTVPMCGCRKKPWPC